MITSIPESEVHNILEFYDMNMIFPNYDHYGLTGFVDMIILLKLLKAVDAKTLFEFGTWEGQTARLLSNYLDMIYTIDVPLEDLHSKSKIPPIQISELRSKEMIGFCSRNLPNVTQLYGDTSESEVVAMICKTLASGVDAVYVDANHAYEYVLCNTFLALELAEKVIIWHDVFHDPVPDVTKALRVLPFNAIHIQESHIGFYLVRKR